MCNITKEGQQIVKYKNYIKHIIWYGNSIFDIIEKYIAIAKYLIKYMTCYVYTMLPISYKCS